MESSPKTTGRKKRRRRKSETKHDDGDATTSATATAVTIGACVSVSDRYKKLGGGRIGQGTYGVVYKARDVQTGRIVALKRCIPHHVLAVDGFPVHCLRELENLRICAACPHTVSLLTVAVRSNSTSVFLVFEYCQYGDLANLVDGHYQRHGNSPFTQEAVKTLLRHLLLALEFVHSHHLIHRDVKLSNLLYTGRGCLKLADFGSSRHYWTTNNNTDSNKNNNDMVLTQKVASLWYRPPEVLLGCRTYTQSIDLWAAGCSFAELLRGVIPALDGGTTEADQIQRIFRDIGLPADPAIIKDYPLIRDKSVQLPPAVETTGRSSSRPRRYRLLDGFAFLSEAGCQLLTCLLQWDPDLRWTAAQALRSPYFTERPLPVPENQMPRFHQ